MPKRNPKPRAGAPRYENIHQIGGIQTGTLDCPSGGPRGGRVAFVDTGSGLRFNVALDRGGDIVEASYNQHNLAFLTPNGYKPPSHAYHVGEDWLAGWPGGLVTSCGPQYIGGPRIEDGVQTSLHGHYSNTPAAIETLLNPDPMLGRTAMVLGLIVRDSRMYGPVVEVRRQIRCQLGVPEIEISDTITNRGDAPVAHNWLYHVNLGYPLLDKGSRVIFGGKRTGFWDPTVDPAVTATRAYLDALKVVPDPLPTHTGENNRGVIVDPIVSGKSERSGGGGGRIGLINPALCLGVQLEYSHAQLPRLGIWQHYGPSGSYVCGLEPFTGSLQGKAKDTHRQAGQMLAPGAVRKYDLKIKVLTKQADLDRLQRYDGAVTV